MTNLNEEQTMQLQAVLTGVKHLEIQLEKLKKQYEEEIERAKDNLRELGAAAKASGVPMRQIGFALGTSDHKTIRDMTTVRELPQGELVEIQDNTETDSPLSGIEWVDDKIFLVTDSTPTTWELWALDIDEVTLVNKSSATGRATNEGADLSDEAVSIVEGTFKIVEWGD